MTGQIDESGERVDYPKTSAGDREIELAPMLVSELRRYKMASPFSGLDDYIICGHDGRPMERNNLRNRAVTGPAKRAGVEGVTFHALRHTFASILINQDHDVIYIARQMGHEKPSITMDTYGHLFDRQKHAEKHRSRMQAEFADIVAQGS